MEWQTLKNVIEILYYLSGPALVVIAAIGLYQLYLAKRDIQLRSQREAATLAAAEARHFNTRIIELTTQARSATFAEKIELYEGEVGDFSPDSVKDAALGRLWDDAHHQPKAAQALGVINSLLNELEAFALYFTKGVADEEIAFVAVGRYFCDLVRRYYPVIAKSRTEKQEDAFQPIVDLYHIWHARVAEPSLKKKAEAIKQELASLPKPRVKPIGTE